MRQRLAIALICAAQAAFSKPAVTLDAVLSLAHDDAEFGGLSALEISGSGFDALAFSDRGQAYRLRLDRSNGRLSSMTATKAPQFSKTGADTEGLAVDGEGGVFISTEGPAGVIHIHGNGMAKTLPEHPDFDALQANSALEALAIDADGALYTLPERSGAEDRPFPLYMYRGEAWTRGPDLPRRDSFLPTGADFGPDGSFYLLERALSPLGFKTRVRRFDLDAPDLGEVTLLETSGGTHGNLEGISVWQDSSGQMRITMVSDDNFLWVQRSELVEYILTE